VEVRILCRLYFADGNIVNDILIVILFSVLILHIGEAIVTSFKQYKSGQNEFLALLTAFALMAIGLGGGTLSSFLGWTVSSIFPYLTTLSVPLALIVMPIMEVIYTNRELQQTLDKNKRLHESKLEAEQEKKKLIENRKEELEQEVQARTSELEEAYEELKQSHEELKAAQEQLVQQEKLDSLGKLTAGIAHEIKNPLNFVNNFSDLSVELVEEARDEVDDSEVLDILDDVEANLKKINEHGDRADGIVKSMLQHSRGGDGEMESTDLNALIEEYVNLAFHGMRASEHPINVDIELDLDESVGEVPLIAEDFSRVIINLCNNAFDAMRKKQVDEENYDPTLSVRTRRKNDQVLIEVEDNGPGIPEDMKDKIMQPFFTTKEGTEGTGLGLSITNDIIKAHGGQLETKSNKEGSIFRIHLN
jgi:signal transduction histidine kinase